jgi:hypothetical protein
LQNRFLKTYISINDPNYLDSQVVYIIGYAGLLRAGEISTVEYSGVVKTPDKYIVTCDHLKGRAVTVSTQKFFIADPLCVKVIDKYRKIIDEHRTVTARPFIKVVTSDNILIWSFDNT